MNYKEIEDYLVMAFSALDYLKKTEAYRDNTGKFVIPAPPESFWRGGVYMYWEDIIPELTNLVEIRMHEIRLEDAKNRLKSLSDKRTEIT